MVEADRYDLRRRRIRRRSLLAAAAGIAGAAFATACGNSGPRESGGKAASPEASSSSSPARTTVTTLGGQPLAQHANPAGLADGPEATARFNQPLGLAVDRAGVVYVADSNNNRIRKVSPDGTVTTLAGSGPSGRDAGGYLDGPANLARFYSPHGMALNADGVLYVVDTATNRIRSITPHSPQPLVLTVAGGDPGMRDGQGVSAEFYNPTGIAVDKAGIIYVADSLNHRVRRITTAGIVTTLAGSGPSGLNEGGYADGPGSTARFNFPNGVAVDSSGNLYVAELHNNRIRKVSPSGAVTTLAGSGGKGDADGQGPSARFNGPEAMAIDQAGMLYVTDLNGIRLITPQGLVTTMTLPGIGGDGLFGGGIAVDGRGTIYVSEPDVPYIVRITRR